MIQDHITYLRRLLDENSQKAGRVYNSSTLMVSPVADATKALLMSKAWLGKLIGELGGTPSPYKDGYQTVKDIQPTADKVQLTSGVLEARINPDELVIILSKLRVEIGKLADGIKDMDVPQVSTEALICKDQAWVYAVEARLHLGFALEAIREHSLKYDKVI